MKVKAAHDSIELPNYETNSSAGMDLRAYLPDGSISLHPKQRALIGTGLYFEIPEGFEVQIRPRSGLAFKHGITVLNSPGTIDADYRGEIKVILINHGEESFLIEHEMRIAQMVVAQYQRVQFKLVKELTSSERGSGGFGSTGTQ
jgi:dUTP pyrophosphatase